MSDAKDVVSNSKQLADTGSTWGKTPRDLRNEYKADSKGAWGGQAIHASAVELTQKHPSRSEFRDHDKPIDTVAGLVINIDARVHEFITIYYAVELGHKPSIEILKKNEEKSELAQAALDKINEK